MKPIYKRNVQQLRTKAAMWWPKNLVDIEADSSIVPYLVETQNRFISVLTLAKQSNPFSVFEIIEVSKFSANLFLKHLMVLVDFGGEPFQRINKDFLNIFPGGKLRFFLDGGEHEHKFTELPTGGVLNSSKMRNDTRRIYTDEPLTDFYKDLFVILLFGGNSIVHEQAEIFSKCVVGNLIGKGDELAEFIKQRYIYVSRITTGAQANKLGNSAQDYLEHFLSSNLGEGYRIQNNGHIPNVTQNDGRTLTSFDLVVSKGDKYVAVEISFQVTTNSVIERKGGQARERFAAIEASGNYISYVIDGAGNFQRESALTTICTNSHCTVAYKDEEFRLLVAFIKEKLR